ncbi:zinc ribbon domain-containing protein [Mesoterricola silvestris]|uniref:Zinc finger/thioredoxin putative domain-containing protein n=1 Tax=Mesoterricola silvestris TaxID=2927979 RepID=A0AA48K7I5_9BACT|nr:hypothetical protein [Mesoterricola silvestris]BDU71180.1 hypothetical protein METEAL_03540 [Mesoterricola silvestris]
MTETIRCPGCSTRFTLTPGRVHAGLRRAKCFRCETIFDIAEVVGRLLPEPAPAPVPEPAPMEEPSLFARFDDPAPPSLTLGDLEGADDEIMEKTLVINPPPGEAAAEAEATAETEADPEAGASGSFSSARDAISKLMGEDAPAAHASTSERRFLGSRSPMDVEATLSALDVTLGGNAPAPSPAPEATTSTVKLSAQEIQAAMASVGARSFAPPPPPHLPPPPPPHLPPPPPPRAEMPPPPRPLEAPAAPGAELLKIQMEQETMNSVSIDQVTAWIEQGRVHEYHMVARQFSDHWIEAVKVPALRPVFERRRRDGVPSSAEVPAPAPEMAPAKKSLFGGLFGRN